MNKIWKIQGFDKKLSDEELIEMIKNRSFLGDNKIKTNEMKKYLKIKDTIYNFYLRGK